MPVGRVAVPKGSQQTASPRRDGSEIPLGGAGLPKTGYDTGEKPPGDRMEDGPPRRAATQCLIFTARGFFIGQMLVANDFISIFVD